jgi:hypothetical protein
VANEGKTRFIPLPPTEIPEGATVELQKFLNTRAEDRRQAVEAENTIRSLPADQQSAARRTLREAEKVGATSEATKTFVTFNPANPDP